MSDSSRNFEIKITTVADTAGANEANKALDAGSEKTKLFAGETRELNKSARELSRAFPEVADAVRLLAGPAGVIFIAIQMFVKAKEALDGWNKSLDDTIAKNADPSFLESINAKKTALDELTAAYYRDEAAAYAAATATDAENTALAAHIALIKSLATGGGEAGKEKALQDEINADKFGYREQNANRDAAHQRAMRDEAALKRDTGRELSDEGTLKAVNKQLDEMMPAAAAAQDRMAWLTAQMEKAEKEGFKPGDSQIKWITDAMAESGLTISNFDALNSASGRIGARLPGERAAVAADAARLKQDQAEEKAATDAMRELKKSIDELTAALNGRQTAFGQNTPGPDVHAVISTHVAGHAAKAIGGRMDDVLNFFERELSIIFTRHADNRPFHGGG